MTKKSEMYCIQIKRIYESFQTTDGYRVLIDRLWPRGMSKADARVDYWAKHLAPSDDLRRWFGHQPEKFDEFQRQYLEELSSNALVAKFLRQLDKHRTVTLLYAAADTRCNNAIVLRELIRRYCVEDFES